MNTEKASEVGTVEDRLVNRGKIVKMNEMVNDIKENKNDDVKVNDVQSKNVKNAKNESENEDKRGKQIKSDDKVDLDVLTYLMVGSLEMSIVVLAAMYHRNCTPIAEGSSAQEGSDDNVMPVPL